MNFEIPSWIAGTDATDSRTVITLAIEWFLGGVLDAIVDVRQNKLTKHRNRKHRN
jgi:hypothetical protein